MPLERALELYQQGEINAAIQCLRRLIQSEPADAMVWDYLGVFSRSNNDLPAALDAGTQATNLDPKNPQAWNNLGNTYVALNDDAQAMAAYQRALGLAANYADAWANQGMAEKRAGNTANAIASLSRAAGLLNENAAALNTIANQLFELEAYSEAVSCYLQAVITDPLFSNAYNNLGNTRLKLLEPNSALEAYKNALDLEPDHHDALNGYAQTLLLTGNYGLGWRAYEARRRVDDPETDILPWTGTPLAGKTLLLYAEQGAGDTIQFLRFIKHLKKVTGKVILKCSTSLVALASQVEGLDQVVNMGTTPQADVYAPLMSLPYLLGLAEISNVEISAPYLKMPPPHDLPLTGKRVGLVWAGNPDHINDKNRSLDLTELLPIVSNPAIEFFSLQMGPAKNQLEGLNDPGRIKDLTDTFTTYTDTARAIAGLDLILTVDTSIAHLAGAMGKPCWVLLPFVPDWRWQLGRDDTPWYPSVRLFRQPGHGNWDAVVRSVSEELQIYTKER